MCIARASASGASSPAESKPLLLLDARSVSALSFLSRALSSSSLSRDMCAAGDDGPANGATDVAEGVARSPTSSVGSAPTASALPNALSRLRPPLCRHSPVAPASEARTGVAAALAIAASSTSNLRCDDGRSADSGRSFTLHGHAMSVMCTHAHTTAHANERSHLVRTGDATPPLPSSPSDACARSRACHMRMTQHTAHHAHHAQHTAADVSCVAMAANAPPTADDGTDLRAAAMRCEIDDGIVCVSCWRDGVCERTVRRTRHTRHAPRHATRS
jgi:hypothetical protein